MLVGEEIETFFIKVWKPLPNRRVQKILKGSPNRTISPDIIFSNLLGIYHERSTSSERRD